MDRIATVISHLENMNFIPNFIWQQIWQDSTKGEQQAFIDWLEVNKIGVSPQARLGAIMFIDIPSGKFMNHSDFDKYRTTETKKAKIEITEPLLNTPTKDILRPTFEGVNTITCTKYSTEYPCGWLSPHGKFIECDWGDHEAAAADILRSLNVTRDAINTFRKTYGSYYRRDYLVKMKNYVLLDCPSNSGLLSITYHRLTKSQKDFLTDYLLKIEDSYVLNKIVEQ